ncbi:MAG: DUF3306 domain-containing protein [Pseudomonadota bacterium]
MTTDRNKRTTNPLQATDDNGFLGRWSRRKAEARTADVAPKTDAESEQIEGVEGTRSTEEAERPTFDIESLPDIDSLGPTSDFSVFMQSGVPADLKTKALRKLWRVKADLANLDGLIDYGEDLTGSFKVVDQLKTAYEVGRGFLRDDQESKDDQQAMLDDDAVAPSNQTSDEGAPPENSKEETSSPAIDADGITVDDEQDGDPRATK